MIEKTEFGVLISYEDWELIQEKLEEGTESTAVLPVLSSEIRKLRKENEGLRRTLNTMNFFLTSSAEVKE